MRRRYCKIVAIYEEGGMGEEDEAGTQEKESEERRRRRGKRWERERRSGSFVEVRKQDGIDGTI